MFDFTTRINRHNTGSSKWSPLPQDNASPVFPPLSVADMELPVAPCISDALHQAVNHKIYGYTIPDEAYLNTVVSWFSRRHNISIDPEWIVVTPGVVLALRVAVRALTESDEGVIIQPPVYYPFSSVIEGEKRRVVHNPLLYDGAGHYSMNLDELEKLAQNPKNTMFILCSPANPVSRVWEIEVLKEVFRICKENNVVLVADEIHGDITLGSEPFVSVLELDDMALHNTVICTAASKTFNLAGLTSSNIIIPDKAIRKIFSNQLRAEGVFGMGFFSRVATMAAFTDGDKWLDVLIGHLKENRKRLVDGISELLPEVIFTPTQGTYLPWSDWRTYFTDADDLEHFMRDEAGLILDEGKIFGRQGEGFERFNIATPASVIEEALQRIEYAAQKRGLI